MSRSRRRVPIAGNAKADSDKAGKVADTRRLRRRVSQTLAQTHDGDALPHDHAVRDPWNWPKDGKAWHGRNAGVMRK